MIRLPARLVLTAPAALALAAPLAAQQSPGTFSLPPATPSPTPTPAGPADERAGIAIPPRAVPTPSPTPAPTASPTPLPTSAPRPVTEPVPGAGATPTPRPAVTPPPARPGAPSPAPLPQAAAPAAAPPDPAATTAPEALPSAGALPPPPPTTSAPAPLDTIAPDAAADASGPTPLPWWPYAAGGLGALALLGGAALLRRRRGARPQGLAAPVAARPAAAPPAQEPPRVDPVLEITSATRSLMMFTLDYRLTVANRSELAVGDLAVAIELVCARASVQPGAPRAGALPAPAHVTRIGPHQARSISGTVQLPLSAISPLRQGRTPLFVPLVHVTIEAEGRPALHKTFVIGTPSASGRVHPIALDQPPGGIPGLVAQAVAVPAPPAAAPAAA